MNNLALGFFGLVLTVTTCAKEGFLEYKAPETPTVTIEPTSAAIEEDMPDLINWFGKYDANSLEKALKEDKLVMLYFYSPESESCKKQSEVFQDPAVASLINKNFVSYKMDVRDIPPKGRIKLELSSLPVIYFLFPNNPKTKSIVKQFKGYQDSDTILENIIIAQGFRKIINEK